MANLRGAYERGNIDTRRLVGGSGGIGERMGLAAPRLFQQGLAMYQQEQANEAATKQQQFENNRKLNTETRENEKWQYKRARLDRKDRIQGEKDQLTIDSKRQKYTKEDKKEMDIATYEQIDKTLGIFEQIREEESPARKTNMMSALGDLFKEIYVNGGGNQDEPFLRGNMSEKDFSKLEKMLQRQSDRSYSEAYGPEALAKKKADKMDLQVKSVKLSNAVAKGKRDAREAKQPKAMNVGGSVAIVSPDGNVEFFTPPKQKGGDSYGSLKLFKNKDTGQSKWMRLNKGKGEWEPIVQPFEGFTPVTKSEAKKLAPREKAYLKSDIDVSIVKNRWQPLLDGFAQQAKAEEGKGIFGGSSYQEIYDKLIQKERRDNKEFSKDYPDLMSAYMSDKFTSKPVAQNEQMVPSNAGSLQGKPAPPQGHPAYIPDGGTMVGADGTAYRNVNGTLEQVK